MSKVFRGRFIALLKERLPGDNKELINELYKNKWVVYAKRPFTGPQSVVEYLGRYTHKIAISNHRIKNISDGKVTFSYKDYGTAAAVTKEMTLDALEFIRRFAMHILPKGFVRIRHYGIVSSTSKAACAVVIKEQLPRCRYNKIQNQRRKFIIRCNAPVAKKKPCKHSYALTAEGHRMTGSKWLKIYWNALFEKYKHDHIIFKY